MTTRLATVTLAAGLVLVAGCGGGGEQKTAAADSLQRDLELAPVDTSATLQDAPTETPAQPAPKPSAPRPQPTQPKPTAPKPAAAPRLAAGTEINATVDDSVTSRHDKPGRTIHASVASDLRDANGKVVIPAGASIELLIEQLAPSENKSDSTGKLVIAPKTITVGGKAYVLVASVESVEYSLKGRGVQAGDAAKVGGGAAAGAIVGKLIGKKTGAIVGGVVGAAAGTAIAVETADRDVVISAGAPIKLKLLEDLVLG